MLAGSSPALSELHRLPDHVHGLSGFLAGAGGALLQHAVHAAGVAEDGGAALPVGCQLGDEDVGELLLVGDAAERAGLAGALGLGRRLGGIALAVGEDWALGSLVCAKGPSGSSSWKTWRLGPGRSTPRKPANGRKKPSC